MKKASDVLFGGIDAGGTKWACAIGTSPDDIRASTVIETATPTQTLEAVADFFSGWMARGNPLDAVGVSCFGPLILDKAHPRWGCLYNSPKPGWEHTDIGPFLARKLPVPIGMDTDVNGSALAEQRWGNARDVDDFVYVSVGTGVGGAVIANGRLVNGGMHPEMGHSRPRRHPSDDYAGRCPYHADCYEGLISGPAILESSGGISPERLPDDDDCWKFVGHYLGQMCSTAFFNLSTKRIVLGGGVMHRDVLMPLIRDAASREINGYLRWPDENHMAQAITRSYWVENRRKDDLNSGVFGGFIIAEQALRSSWVAPE